MWARWDSKPEENANEPRGRAESERRRMVWWWWWFGNDCGVESLVSGEQEDSFGAGGFRAEIGRGLIGGAHLLSFRIWDYVRRKVGRS